jgi:hypothetical protein
MGEKSQSTNISDVRVYSFSRPSQANRNAVLQISYWSKDARVRYGAKILCTNHVCVRIGGYYTQRRLGPSQRRRRVRDFLSNIRKLTVCYRFQFSDAFAFSEAGLNLRAVVPFLTEFATQVIITGHKTTVALPSLLSSSTGCHTGIVHFQPTSTGVTANRFEWLHHEMRPNGSKLPIQCKECGAYRAWVLRKSPTKYNKTLKFKCNTKKCTGRCEVPRLKGYKHFPVPLMAGKWYSKEI